MYRLLIIDDEKAIRSVISDMLRMYVPDVEIVGEASSVETGIEAIRKYSPDIVLLDIRLSDGNGFELLDRIGKVSFKVIFVTAYDEYALLAFRYSAVDYILKPIDPEELSHAIHKAGSALQSEMEQRLSALRQNLSPDHHSKKILLKTSENIYLVGIDDIDYLESDQAYTRIYLEEEKVVMVSRNLGEFEEMLRPAGFFRVHKSYLVNLAKIDHFERANGGFVVMLSGSKIPVASRKKEQFLHLIENLT